jgi:hypothetical protein
MIFFEVSRGIEAQYPAANNLSGSATRMGALGYGGEATQGVSGTRTTVVADSRWAHLTTQIGLGPMIFFEVSRGIEAQYPAAQGTSIRFSNHNNLYLGRIQGPNLKILLRLHAKVLGHLLLIEAMLRIYRIIKEYGL